MTQVIFASGKIFFVFGSDTAIWNGLNVERYNCYYKLDLYDSPTGNAEIVMSDAFRSKLKDYYGNPMKLTWWMMGGNVFRYAVNNNIPNNNSMTLHLIKKYQGEQIKKYGDELSLHYHTFDWTDYNEDGVYYWNQAKKFMDCLNDFNYTLAEYLVNEDVFPVSFRSGWHYMDNGWQKYLNELLPYSMHNAWPSKKLYDDEPVDNVIDWSLAPNTWIPFHPSPDNYQIPGNSRGWNLRSAHLTQFLSGTLLKDIFSKASLGEDQVVCVWGHLPETDFADNLVKIDSLIHALSPQYPDVVYEYPTAVEAMQKWLKTEDTEKPIIDFHYSTEGEKIRFKISSSEELFQLTPFVAVKDIDENYFPVKLRKVSALQWESRESYEILKIAKASIAVSDVAGNQTIKSINFIPDNIFIDDESAHTFPLDGVWQSYENVTWGRTSLQAEIPPRDTVSLEWIFSVDETRNYNISVQLPEISNPMDSLKFQLHQASRRIIEKKIAYERINEWVYLFTFPLNVGENYSVKLIAENYKDINFTVAADVIKISPLVKKADIAHTNKIQLENIIEQDTTVFAIYFENRGLEPISITNFESNLDIKYGSHFPIDIPVMQNKKLSFQFVPPKRGIYNDTLRFTTNNSELTEIKIPFFATAERFYKIIDNEDYQNYFEIGKWNTSVTQAFGNSSRYTSVKDNLGASAEFKSKLNKEGMYEVSFIVPKTVNSAENALYIVAIENIILDSVYVNQNENSNSWVVIGNYYLPREKNISVTVMNKGGSSDDKVMRADAVRFSLVEEVTGLADESGTGAITDYQLFQNYPNPFNPKTVIKFQVPSSMFVKLHVYDILGREAKTLVNEYKSSGIYEVSFDASSLASGLYFYKLTAGNFSQTKKMLLLK